MRVLITSGGTRVPIDSVRFIGNMSSGNYGAEIARQFLGYTSTFVNFLHDKHSITPKDATFVLNSTPINATYESFPFTDYFDYAAQAVSLAQNQDIIISAAAVSDYIVDPIEGKIPSNTEELTIKLRKSRKIIQEMRKVAPKAIIIGFKLLVSPRYEEVFEAVQKVLNNGANYVVYNDLTEIKKGNYSRLFFDKHMKYVKFENAADLVGHIVNKYTEYKNF